MRRLKYLTLVVAAAAALALAGCGGSGSSTTATEQSPADTPPADNPAQLAALKSAHAQAKAALATLQDDLGDATRAEIDDAKAKLAELERVLAAAAGVSARTKEMYAAGPIKTELAAAEQAAAPTIAAGNEKQAAIDAAKKALDAAEAAKDLAANGRDATEAEGDTPAMAAKTGSAKAQEAVMGLVSVQTGGGKAKMHADKAVEAAGKAEDAYEAAKKAYETARAAPTVTAAVRARRGAEDARRDAEMYAKTANDEAMKAVQAAAMELGRSGDDMMTWSIGSGSDKKSITVTTAGTDVTAPHPGDEGGKVSPSSNPTLEQLGQDRPGVRSQNLALGKQHGDDTARLRLMGKYYFDKGESGVYFGVVTASGGPPTISGTADDPGTVTIHANSGILGAAGKTFDLTKVANPAFLRSVEGTPPGTRTSVSEMGLTYDETDNPEGDQYVTPVSNITVGGGGDAGTNGDLYSYSYTYRDKPRTGYIMIQDGSPLQAHVIKGKYSIPAIYDHMHVNYGMWNTLKDKKPADLGIGFVTVLEGKDKTPLAGMPRILGTATYQGGWVATVRGPGEPAPADKATNFSEHQGLSEVTADFGKNTVKVDLKLARYESGGFGEDETFATLSGGAIDGNGFMGTEVSVLPGGTPSEGGGLEKVGLKSSEDGFTGEFSGAFYGPKAEEVGGVFDFDGKKLGAFRGAFGGGRGEETSGG